MHTQIIAGNAVNPVLALAEGLATKRSAATEPCEAVAFSETMIDVDRSGDKKRCEGPIAPDRSAIDEFVAALVRTRGVDHLGEAVITRHWLATDMRVTVEDLDRLLKLLRWQGLIELPNDHLVTVVDGSALKEIALCSS